MRRLSVLLLLFVLAYGCGHKSEDAKQDKKATGVEKRNVLAIVGSEHITLEEFSAEFRPIRKEYPEKLTPALSLTLTKIKKEFLENLITERFLLQIAKSSGVFLNSDERGLAVRRAIGHNLEDAREMVEAQGVDFPSWLKKVTEKATANKLITQEVYGKISVTNDEIKRYVSSNPSLFVHKEKRHLLQIVMETEAEALSALRKIRRGKSFKKIAKSVSVFEAGEQRTDIGYVDRGKLLKKLEEAGFSLKKGKVSEVIRTKHGFHILKCIDINERCQMSSKEAYPIARSRLIEQKSGKAYKNWVNEKRKNIKIVVNPDLLKIKENIIYREGSGKTSL